MATVSTSNAESLQMERARKIRDKYGRFRILVIGRANAGKTTILKVVCNTTEDPEVFDSWGRKIESSVLTPSGTRGQHNIENEMVFRNNPGFIFHDSRGFEAGGTDELKKVQAFIAKSSEQKRLEDRVHAIWYCIPMDESRPFTQAEARFFSDCGTGKVPVIVIFTKFDALESKAYGMLRKQKVPYEDRGKQVALRASQDFAPVLERLNTSLYRPKSHICLRNLHRPDALCDELLECTASALDDNVLKLLFVSTQQNNLKLCVKHAIESSVMKEILKYVPTKIIDHIGSKVGLRGIDKDDMQQLHKRVMYWFPHILGRGLELELRPENLYLELYELRLNELYNLLELNERHCLDASLLTNAFSFEEVGGLPAIQQIAQFGIATTIIAEHSFFLWQYKQSNCYQVACELYKASYQCRAVKKAVDEAFQDNHKQIFWASLNCAQAQKTFALQLVQIALDNCLPKDSVN